MTSDSANLNSLTNQKGAEQSLVVQRRELRIVRAAIRVDFGAIFSLPIPARHCDLIKKLRENGYTGQVQGDRQGFLLNDGRFVMRKAAGTIARRNGQLLKGKQIAHVLTSEDLW